MGLTHEEIEKMINEGEYKLATDFQEDTFVGTGCGRCLVVVDDIFRKKEE